MTTNEYSHSVNKLHRYALEMVGDLVGFLIDLHVLPSEHAYSAYLCRSPLNNCFVQSPDELIFRSIAVHLSFFLEKMFLVAVVSIIQDSFVEMKILWRQP